MSHPAKKHMVVFLGLLLSTVAVLEAAEQKKARPGFPAGRPDRGSFSRPVEGETIDLSPPGFSWWRAAPRGQAAYRLKVVDERGRLAYESPLLEDPVHVPGQVLPAGRYTWTAEALDARGQKFDTFGPRHFSIAPGAIAQPWVPAKELLSRVPAQHPRIIFPHAKLQEIRATLDTTRREAFAALRQQADSALKLEVPPEPDYDKLPTRAEQRLGYHKAFGELRRYHTSGMVNLALMYVLSGERKYGEHAKALLLGAAEWDPEGISSIMSPFGDEVGLGLVKSAAQTYDWIHDLLSAAEREKVRQMLVARADQMLRRLERRDYLVNPEESHAGRLPGYLLEHAIALAEEPRAEVWLDYGLRALTTVHPHWAGFDGGWAEGLSYGLSYNTTSMAPMETLRVATGFDLWQRPAHRKLRYFFVYNTSPVGEIFGFGDSFERPVADRASGLRGLLEFHAERYQDPVVRGWVDLLRSRGGGEVEPSVLPSLMMPSTMRPASPESLPQDAVFHGVGWAALHSNLARPADDLMVMFKSSPYGGVSHSYCDQNGFAILKGGKALALPSGGTRYPQHGTPFHTRYTQQTRAQTAILVNGQGQVRSGSGHEGRIAAFESTRHLGYVCGDAAAAYGGLLKVGRRHVLLVRPDVVVIVDDLEAPEPSEFQWLLHAWEKLELDEAAQTFVSNRGGASMQVRLFTTDRMSFMQSDAWPVEPREGFPTASAPEPARRWHFSASTSGSSAARRIAAVMTVGVGNEKPDCQVRQVGNTIEVETSSMGGAATVRIDLSPRGRGTQPILEVEYRPRNGRVERISAR